MRVVQALPPMFDEIDAAFHVRGRAVIFAWGDTIYNPAGIAVSAELHAHEVVHGVRQEQHPGNVEGWWRRYIDEPEFRFDEELPAHVAEFKSICDQQRPRWHSERNMRRTIAAHVARKLSAPLYGSLISLEDAKRRILAA